MKINKVRLLLLVSALASSGARALTTSDLDFSLKTGVVTGTVTKPSEPDGYSFGGFPLVIAYNLDESRKVTLGVELSLVLNPSGFQIMRTGTEFVFSYHLFGGARRLHDDYGNIETIATSPYDFSLNVRAGFEHYSAVSKDNPDETATGSTIETMIGFQYRQEIGESSAFCAEVYYGVLSMSASVEQLSASHLMTLFSYRFFL